MKPIKIVIILVTGFVLLVTLGCIITSPPTAPPVTPSEIPGSEEPVTPSEEPVPATEPPVEPTPPPVVPVLKIIYIKSGNVWIWTEGGSPQQVTFSGGVTSPRLSRDGSRVAFIRGNELWAVNADGTGEHHLADQAFLSSYATETYLTVVPYEMLWFGGTHSLVFNTLSIADESGFQVPLFDYKVADSETGISFTTSLGEGGVPYPSPNASMLAFAQPNKVLLSSFPSSGPAVTAFTYLNVLTFSEWMYVPDLVWLPDSSAFRIVVPPQDSLSNPTEPSLLWEVPVSGSPVALTSFVTAPAFFSEPLISPDAQKVVYLVNTAANTEIHVITATGSDTLMLSFPLNSVNLLGWNPDSTRFVFSQPDAIHAKLATGGSFLPLGDTPRVQRIRWIDAERFVFMNENELRLSPVIGASTLLDTNVTEYDLVWVVSE